jgi:arginyl-tRNA synthetase
MKSREGTIVDADDLIEDVRKMAEKNLEKKNNLSKKELYRRSLAVALSAIKYFLLKVDIRKTMLFNPKESLSFEGNTGPYLQYSYARASSILKKAGPSGKFEIKNLDSSEFELVKKLLLFPEIAENSYKTLNPSLVANYSYELCQRFNEFYHSCPVIGSEQESFRLALVQSFRQVLKNSLHLLGIDVLEEM